MKKDEQRSRTEMVIDSILEGGYAIEELQEIMDTCEDEIHKKRAGG